MAINKGIANHHNDDPMVHTGEPGEIEIVDASGSVVGHTGRMIGMERDALEQVLAELSDDTPMASQSDLNHLFGIKDDPDQPSNSYPGAGDFS
jgi:hypothetical protein